MSDFGMNTYNPAAQLQGLYQGQGGMQQQSAGTNAFPFNAQNPEQKQAFWGGQQPPQGPPMDPAVLAYLQQPRQMVVQQPAQQPQSQKLLKTAALVGFGYIALKALGVIGGGDADETPVKPAVKTTIFTRQAQTELDNIKTETWAFQSTDSAKGAVAQYERDASHLFAVYQMKLTEFAGNTAALAKLDKDFAPVREQIQKQHDAIQKQIAEKGWDKDVTIKSPDALYKEVTATMQADKAAGDAAVVKYDAALKQSEDWVKVKGDKVALEKAKTFAQDQIKLLDAEIEAEQAGAKRMGVKMALIRTRDKFQQHVGAITTALGQSNTTTPKGNVANISNFSVDTDVKGIQEGFNKANDLVATARTSTGNADTDRANWEKAKAEVALQLAAAKVVEGKKANELKNEAAAVIQKLTTLQTEITAALGALPSNLDPLVVPFADRFDALNSTFASISAITDPVKRETGLKALKDKGTKLTDLKEDLALELKKTSLKKEQKEQLEALQNKINDFETKTLEPAIVDATKAVASQKSSADAKASYQGLQLNVAYLEKKQAAKIKGDATAYKTALPESKQALARFDAQKATLALPATEAQSQANWMASMIKDDTQAFTNLKSASITTKAQRDGEKDATLLELKRLKASLEGAEKDPKNNSTLFQQDRKALFDKVDAEIKRIEKITT